MVARIDFIRNSIPIFLVYIFTQMLFLVVDGKVDLENNIDERRKLLYK